MADSQFSKALIFMLIGSAIILALSLGVRHAFGLYLVPMSEEFGWGSCRRSLIYYRSTVDGS